MPVYKGPSRTASKESDRLSFKSSRTSSLKTDLSSSRSQGSGSKLKQKLITTSLMKQDEGSKTSSINSSGETKDYKRGQVSITFANKVDGRTSRHYKDFKNNYDASGKNLKQLTLSKGTSLESNKKSLSRNAPSSAEYEESEEELETPRNRNKTFKRSLSNSSAKSTPTKLSGRKPQADQKNKSTASSSRETTSHIDVMKLNHDDDLENDHTSSKIANSNHVPKTHSLNHFLVNGSTDNLYTTLNEEDPDKANDEFRFKRSKRSHYKLQDSILGLISKYQSDLEHLDEKIKSLEAQFFSNPPETTGLVKGWEGNVLNNAYTNISAGLKSRRALNAKFKANFTQTQNLITEHIFSLTSSTCAVSKMLLNN